MLDVADAHPSASGDPLGISGTGSGDPSTGDPFVRHCQIARQLLNARFAFIAVCKDGETKVIAHTGDRRINSSLLDLLSARLCASPSHPVCSDVEDPALAAFAAAAFGEAPETSTTCIHAPLIHSSGRILGVLAAVSMLPREWTKQDRLMLESQAISVIECFALAEAQRAGYAAQKRLDLHLEITTALEHSNIWQEGVKAVLQCLSEHVDAELAEFWKLNEDGTLQIATEWHRSNADIERFVKESASLVFSPGQGLPGLVWQGQVPEWIENLAESQIFLRKQSALGYRMRSGMAFPVCGHHVSGVVTFLCRGLMKRDAALEGTLQALGKQIGAFLDNHHLQELSAERGKFLNVLLDNLSEAVIACDPTGRINFYNKAVEAWHGAPLESCPPFPRQQWIQEHHLYEADGTTPLKQQNAPLFRALAGERVRGVEIVFAPPGRDRARFIVNAQPLLDSKGKTQGAVCVAHDISQIERALAELRRSELRFTQFMENIPAAIFILDSKGRAVFINKRCEQYLGASHDKLQGERLRNFVHPAEIAHQMEALDKYVLQHGKSVEATGGLSLGSGELREWWSIRFPIFYETGVKLIGGIAIDITEQKHAQDTLARREHVFRQLSNVAPVGIFLMDPEGNCTYVNDKWSHITGCPREQAMGMGWLATIHPSHRNLAIEEWQRAVRKGATEDYSTELRAIRPDASEYWIAARCTPLYEDKKITGYVGTIMDVTAQKQAEKVMLQAKEAAENASAAKSRFLAHMSHEVRTPLNGILGVNAMLLSSPLNARQRQLGETIQASAESLLEIVTDILDFSKIEAGHVDFESIDFDLHRLLEQVLMLNSARAIEKGLVVHLDIKNGTPKSINGDPARLRQVLHNLLSNAVKFSEHGEIRLGVEIDQQNDNWIQLRFTVSDQGVGIPLEARDRIFEPFCQADASTTRKFGGSGLGLSICKELVQLMSGEIGFTSEPGKGATFWFTARFAPARSATAQESIPLPRGAPLNLRVLLAEDNSVNRMVATHQLEELGCTVDAVENGEDAAQAVAFGEYELVLMDCHMPVMDGYEATKEIRQRESGGKHIPIIAVTANASRNERERCLASGMDAYVSKPFQPADLRAAINAARCSEHLEAPEPPPRITSEAIGAKLKRWATQGMDIDLLVRMFTEEAEQLLIRLANAQASKDFEELVRAAHKLKGSAAELGDERLRRICEKIQSDGKAAANIAELARGIELARREVEHLERTLRREYRLLQPDPLPDGG